MPSLFFDKSRSSNGDSDIESHEGLLEANPRNASPWTDSRPQRGYPISKTILVLLLALSSGFMGAVIGVSWERRNTNSICIGLTSRPSPITRDLEISWHTETFNGSLLKENVYRRVAGPEVDAAWNDLGVNFHSVVVPAEEAARAGLRHDQVKIQEKYGGGFPANVEGLHQLHCLNLVRQSLYYNFEYYHEKGEGPFMNSDHILQKHVSHCLDIIRQQLMCTVDIGVMGQVWFEPARGQIEAYVDFNTQHICRNFEDVRQWAEDRQMPDAVPEDFLEPPKEGDRVYHQIP